MNTQIILFFCAVALVQGFPNVAQHPEETLTGDLKSGDSRIIGGYPAVNGQFPFQAFLLIKKGGQTFACGGSLIHIRWVLTAASCVKGGTSAEVYLGDVRREHSPVKMTSTNLIAHEDFNMQLKNHDIGLVGLPFDLEGGENINIIQYDLGPHQSYLGYFATISGFGQTNDGQQISQTLNYVATIVIANEECASYYDDSIVIDSTMCAIGAEFSEQGMCGGDIGGPMIIQKNGMDLLIGIMSFWKGKCSDSYPNGLVRTSYYVDWINEKIEQ